MNGVHEFALGRWSSLGIYRRQRSKPSWRPRGGSGFSIVKACSRFGNRPLMTPVSCFRTMPHSVITARVFGMRC